MPNELKFEVGSMYENMKGVYEVISIDDGSMVIRWNNGIEIETSVDLQSRIIERMEKEKEARQQAATVRHKKTQKHKQKGSAGFVGFEEGDFKNTSKDTVWRRRDNIGSAVIKELRSKKTKFSSWAVSMQPEVHWMDVKRHNRKGPNYGIGFFTRVNEKELLYGILIQRSITDRNDELEGWNPFKVWLESNGNESWLKQFAAKHDLLIYDPSRKSFTHGIKVHDENLELRNDKTQDKIESLASFFAAVPNSKQIDLRIEKMMSKEEALSRGENIVEEISALFNDLMPLYELTPVQADAK